MLIDHKMARNPEITSPRSHPRSSGGEFWTSGNDFWSSGNDFWSTRNDFWYSGDDFWNSGNGFWSTRNYCRSSGSDPRRRVSEPVAAVKTELNQKNERKKSRSRTRLSCVGCHGRVFDRGNQ